MVTTEVILRYKITITEAVYGYGHTLIQIKNDGRGFTIEELEPAEARRIIRERDLEKVKKEEYPYLFGDIFTDGKFKKYMNSHQEIKKTILKIIDTLDENE